MQLLAYLFAYHLATSVALSWATYRLLNCDDGILGASQYTGIDDNRNI